MNYYLLYDQNCQETEKIVLDFKSRLKGTADGFIAESAADLDIKPCLGCFGCWVKTPGVCVYKNDDGSRILERFVKDDVVIILTRIPYGCFSPQVKKVMDRIIPILSPNFRIFRKEMHHRLRYKKLAQLIHVSYGEASKAELETFFDLAKSHADNTGSKHLSSPYHFQKDSNLETFFSWFKGEVRA